MTVLIDSNVIIALLSSRDRNHSRAKDLLPQLKESTHGMGTTVDSVFDEV